MDRSYRCICECIALLRNADVPLREKRRLEADFIQIKVALLREADSSCARVHQYDEQYFLDLVAQVGSLAEKSLVSKDFANLSSQLQPIISALSSVTIRSS